MLQNQALQEWMKVNIPDPEQQKIALKQFVIEGKLNPQLEHAIKADPSAFKQVATDVTNKSAQNRALSELQNIGNQGGLRLQDKSALQDAMQESIAKERGDRMSIEQEMARRGAGNSGFALASKLQAQQSGADRNANSSLNIAAKAQDRALQAIMGSGDMATKYRAQDFNEQSARADAEDKINMFNTQNLRDVQSRNLSAQNQAAAQNLSEQQRDSDQNVKQSNYEQEYNKKLMQQQFENQAKVAAGKGGQYGQLAGNALQLGQNLGNLYSNMGQGVAGMGTSMANYGIQQQNNQNQMDMLDKYLKSQKGK
jgi:hypothetical protein